MDENQQEQAAFEQSFASVTGTEVPAPATPVAEAAPAPAPVAEPAAPEAGTALAGEPAAAPAPEGQPAPQVPAAAEEDPEVLDGFKRSEVRRLLASASEVETLKQQLRKANGKIGELNSRIQPPAAAPAATPTPPVAPALPPGLQQFEQDFPEIAEYVRAFGTSPQQQTQAAPPTEVQQPVATAVAQPVQAELDPAALELAVMDRMHKGWRDTVQSQDFNLWRAAQGEPVQTSFASAETADGLSAVLGQYGQWSTARQASAAKSAKGQQRLANAVTPAGNAPKPKTAPTEQDAFEAAFAATMGR